MNDGPRLYGELASWFHLLTRPENYNEEADFAHQLISRFGVSEGAGLLELGAGGGNNAFHLKSHYRMTLTDFSDAMLDNSRRINPECEHVAGDMRTLRLSALFEVVFIHDAIMYMLTEEDLAGAILTAAAHCRSGGVVLIMPDFVKETFRAGTHHGGYDREGRGLRYIEWTVDPEPADNTYRVDFVYMLREGSSPVRVVHDPHVHGIFSRDVWLRLLRDNGFADPEIVQDPWEREVFVARKA